jgi:sugar-specific transcriptional regulator TrmB
MLDTTSLNLLKQTRLSEKQAQTYLALLQLGNSPVSAIAEEAGLKRPITYVVLHELMLLGLVHEVQSSSKRLIYAAADPNTIASQLERTTHDFKDMLPFLRAMQRRSGKPYVTYYSGVEGAHQAFAQIHRPKEARYAVSIQKAATYIPEEIERWKKTYIQGRVIAGGKHLLTNSPEDKVYGEIISKAQQTVRYLDKGQEMEMDLALVDGMSFITTFDDTIHVTVIHSQALYNSLGLLFDLAWSASNEK